MNWSKDPALKLLRVAIRDAALCGWVTAVRVPASRAEKARRPPAVLTITVPPHLDDTEIVIGDITL